MSTHSFYLSLTLKYRPSVLYIKNVNGIINKCIDKLENESF